LWDRRYLGYLVKKAVVNECMGIDLSEAGIRIARKKYPKIAFYQMYMKSEKPYCDYIREKISHIILSEVLEHIDDPSLTLKWVREILAPEGYLLVTVPAGPMTYFEHYIGHFTHYSRETLGTLLRDAGFQDITIFRAGFPGINLIRLGSFLRGKKILKDLDSSNASRSIKAGLKLVELVLRYSAADSRFGWQLIAVARKGSANY
jgi:SAM-dependent methyltransferase